MPIMLDSLNGINNRSNRLKRLADPKFSRLVELIRDGQLAGAIQIRIQRPKEVIIEFSVGAVVEVTPEAPLRPLLSVLGGLRRANGRRHSHRRADDRSSSHQPFVFLESYEPAGDVVRLLVHGDPVRPLGDLVRNWSADRGDTGGEFRRNDVDG